MEDFTKKFDIKSAIVSQTTWGNTAAFSTTTFEYLLREEDIR